MTTFVSMKEHAEAVTIRQVAEQAGVSIGTVDRILHKRGRVSKQTAQRVMATIEALQYKPNIHAALLSKRKAVRIAVIIPYFQSGEFWSLIYEGVKRAERELTAYNPEISIIYYNQFDGESFEYACRNCMDQNPHGVILSPIHRDISARFVEQLNTQKIPVIFLDTCVDSCPYFAYYGSQLGDSAKVLADLLFTDKKVKQIVNFKIVSENGFFSEAFLRREKGLKQFIEDNNIACEVFECVISPSNFLHDVSIFDRFFKEHPDVHNAITMTSRAHLIADWVEIRGVKGLTIMGYDMTPANVRALKKGTIRYLIAQRTDDQAFTATKALVEYLSLGTAPAMRDNLFPIDILTKYNVDYYLR